MADHPIKRTNFLKYADTPLQRYVLPIIPVGAKLKATSKLTADQLGKIPGLISSSGGEWTGFKWQSCCPNRTVLKCWETWQTDYKVIIPLGLRLGDMIVVIDFDVENETYLNRARNVAERHLGVTPVVRRRDGSIRCVLVYRHKAGTQPITKFAGAYLDEQGQKQLIETLGTGQQVVLEGPHAKGAMHYWEGGRELVDHLDEIPEITRDMVSAFYMELDAIATTAFGYTKHKLALPGGGGGGPTTKISDPKSPHLAGDRGLLTEALGHIDLDHPDMDYDAFIALLRAICASVGSDLDYLHEVVWPWVCTNQKEAHGEGPRTEEQGVEWLEERWASFTDSQLGIEYIYGVAADHGFPKGLATLAQAIFNADPLPDLTTDQRAIGPNATGSADEAGTAASPGQPPSGSSGPNPYPYTDLALADRFAAEHPDWKFTPDEGWMKLENGVYVPNPTIIDPIGRMCSTVGDPYRGQGGRQVGIDVAMKSQRTHARVEQKLRSHPAMFVRPENFDIDPWLLNTPDYVVDLRTGTWMNHKEALESGILMRNQTAVTPDFEAYCHYEHTCPRFLEALHNMTEDEQDFALLGRHGAAGLVGTDLGQYLLFIYGQGGTGKSAFSDILMRIDGHYGTSGSTTLFMKQNDKRPFELGDIAHARALFVPETLKGMTWDDALICSMLGGVPIRVERKHRDSKHVRVFMTITITGNHLPHFITSSQPNKSGIDRRLLLLKVDKLLQGKIDDHYARKLVDEEGPAILMWFIQHAMEGYQSLQKNGSFYGDTVNKAKAAAEAYKAEMSPHLQWMEEEDVILESGTRTNAHQAWRSYKDYIKDDNPLHRETKEEFRDNLAAATNGAITYGRFGDERVFFGMRFKNAPAGENVVPFPPIAAVKDGRTDAGDAAKNSG